MTLTAFLAFFFSPFRVLERFPTLNCRLPEGVALLASPDVSIYRVGQRREARPDDFHEPILLDLWGLAIAVTHRPGERGDSETSHVRKRAVSPPLVRRHQGSYKLWKVSVRVVYVADALSVTSFRPLK